MNIEVVHGHFARAGRLRFERGNSDGVEKTETHGAVRRGVVSGRPKQAESRFAFARRLQRMQRPANGTQRMLVNLWIGGGVAIKISGGIFHMCQVSLGVSA